MTVATAGGDTVKKSPAYLMTAVLAIGVATPAFGACNKAITVGETQQMNYGTIVVPSSAGTVTLTANGTLNLPGGFSSLGVPSVGTFHVTGTNNCSVTISFVAGSLVGPGAPMQILNFTTNAGANPILSPAGGALDFNVGADLVVNAGQTGGSYSGTYTVTVIY